MSALRETVAERIVRALKRHGVELIFAQSLPSAVILAAEAIGIRQIAYRQENMGGAMADGYARRSGRISVVAAQNGPAATLLVAPLAEALKASVPVVALVQEVERPHFDRNAFQELDHTALFQPCAKWVRRLITADRVDDYVDAAFTAAGSGRPGPAVLLLPADLLRESVLASGHPRTAALGTWPIDRSRPGDEALSAAAKLLVQARQPIVMAGGGALSAGAPQALSRLQEAAHLPVVTTPMGKGVVDEAHPLSAGVLGPLTGPGSMGRHSRRLLEDADVIVLVGTRTNQNGTDSWRSIPASARIIHIDVDPAEIGRNYEALRLVGDAAETLTALADMLSRCDLSRRLSGRVRLEREIAEMRTAFEAERGRILARNSTSLRPERVMMDLQRCLTPATTVVADASYSSMWVAGQLQALAVGQRFLTPRGLAGLGWGLPMAMGAKLASREAPVVALVGDGGFAHSWAELETMVRLGIAVTVIVLNNGVLGYQKDAETVKFGSYTSACHFAPVDHAALARACGCSAFRVEHQEEVLPALQTALAAEEPWLIEIMTDPDAHPPLSLYDGTLDAAERSPALTEAV
ncbi:acetolactate synthase catalytic subunit [Mesorhizobium sp.]|uniref:acetolactate synthase catalytic subunit n=1 Tax=Mesorhizobium sp. TaxID=1871066 RepID=UPI000FE8A433|nr:acetolactate synthase catalytic subunit [Mesorhizobium sp.]RWG06084.1 MAG: acetolactate synthase catalytic subunit [Mesorhizobium sp.]RWG97566.1 MAG: acetolactate synthase catalytic subunit [Mesorhizobium sp.]RWI16551.1 MAG: acetolactate synthase catalytic subunit [Mesorhizobium sp.]RWN07620.1 MAG: acetolactate synthase catalytic subunit [Mesorhizobium sp.]RWN12459.1 MAG: acetolactate synthase catalytic subunit [Mesorhizobium sp.]